MSQPSTQEPTRLLDDPNLDLGLRSDLEIASTHAPIAYSLDAGLQRFEQAVNGVSTIPPGGSVSGLRVLGWFVGAVALIGGAAWLLQTPSEVEAPEQVAQIEQGESVAEPQPPEAEPAVVAPSSDAVVAEQPVVDTTADATPDPPEPAQPTSNALAPPSEPATHEAPKPSLADEAAQINQARKALAANPAKTLALMQDAETRFPDGVMIQERRGYTILALAALGRTDDAQERAEAYLERWPKGPLSRRVRDALER